MTQTPKDGGPAFPGFDPASETPKPLNGMSLRDWFAGHAPPFPAEAMTVPEAEALAGISYDGITFGSPEHWAFWADAEAAWKLLHADAMLKAREG